MAAHQLRDDSGALVGGQAAQPLGESGGGGPGPVAGALGVGECLPGVGQVPQQRVAAHADEALQDLRLVRVEQDGRGLGPGHGLPQRGQGQVRVDRGVPGSRPP
ncbi:hypothetical protein EES47_24865 [Streptomyces sp. ADI98-12]|nr:hypothetical protein EES47_24865 [Streptomyces sp. ADI98-12]